MMKKAFAVFTAIILMPSLNAYAWVGGPWSNNNSAPSGDNGIYEAVATMSNGTGLYRWAVRNDSVSSSAQSQQTGGANTQPQSGNVLFGGGTLTTISSNVWYYKGITYYGQTFGTVNSSMGIVSVIANATELTNNGTINNVPVNTPAGVGAGVDVEIIPASGIFDTNSVLVTARPQEYPSTANSSFTATIRKGGTMRFSGSGVIAFTRQTDSVRILTFSLSSNADVTIDGSTSSATDPTEFQKQGHQRKFKVIGTQVSTQVLP